MRLKDKVLNVINQVVPKGTMLVETSILADAWNRALSETARSVKELLKHDQMLNTQFGEDTAFPKTLKIRVGTTGEQGYLIESGWFSKEEIQIRQQAEADSQEILDVMSEIAPMFGSRGNHYREMNPDQIRLAQDACYARMRTDPIFSGAIKQLVNYVVGTGIHSSTQSKEINDVFDNFKRINHFDEDTALEVVMVFRHFLEGEQFLLCDVDPVTGDVYISYLETYEITDWELHPAFRDKVLAYRVSTGGPVRWVADFRYFDEYRNTKNALFQTESKYDLELDPTQFIIHVKENLYPEFRGRPFATAALRYFKWAEDFLADRVILNHERSRVVWIRTILGRAATSIANYLAAPPGGVMLNQTDDIKYDVLNSEVHADDVKEDYLSILYAIASCFLMPIHVFNMRANEQVYASVLSAKAPFTKAIETWQDFFGRVHTKILRVVIREKLKAKQLKSKVTVQRIVDNKVVAETVDITTLKINHTFPNPVDEKLNDQTSNDEMKIKYGLVSLRTTREKYGLNHDEEKFRISQESEERAKIGALQPKQQGTSLDNKPSGDPQRYK